VAVHSDAIEVLVQLDCDTTSSNTIPAAAAASITGLVGRG
jgi:hypothetical protein